MRFRPTVIICFVLSVFNVSGQQPPAVTRGSVVSKKSNLPNEPALPEDKAKAVSIPRFETAPVIDGQLDEKVWAQAAVLKNFYQIDPGDNIAPSRETITLLGYDARNLYVAFRAYDEPDKIRATVAKRDAVSDDDNIRIYLDTFNDQNKAYLLIFNPLGVQADAIFTEDKGEDYSVDIVMESKGRLTSDGYTVEVTIPFRSLRYRAGPGRMWGIQVQRRIKHLNDELDSWMPISRDKTGTLNQMGHITGLENLSGERTLDLIPSIAASESGSRVRTLSTLDLLNNPTLLDPGRFVNEPAGVDLGLTMKYGITSTASVDLAINPDFAQVESDQLVITANQRFPIFFEEKRPFFLEGIEIFQTPLNTVHTRTIIDPEVAVKLTGKSTRHTYGLILASDAAPGNFSEDEKNDPNISPRIDRFVGKNAYVAVLRLKRDLGGDSSIGLIGTAYSFIDKHNYLGGFDGRNRIDAQTVLTYQIIGTASRQFFFDPDLGRNIYRPGSALGYSVNWSSIGRHFGYSLSGEGFTRDYRANVGFTRRVNTNLESLNLQYKSEPKPKATLISWNVQNRSSIRFDFQGRLQVWDQSPQLSLNFSRQTYLVLYGFFGRERLFEEEFGAKRTAIRPGAFAGPTAERGANYKAIGFSFGTRPSKTYSLDVNTYYSPGIFDFDFGAGPRFPRVSPAALANPNAPLDPGPGNKWSADLSFAYQPSESLRITFDYTKTRLLRQDTGLIAFDDNIYSTRATYQFTRFTFVRARVDYDTLALRAQGQFLFGWTPNPGTSFYIGYNDDLSRNGFNPFTGQPEPGLHRNTRTFFIKITYLFRRSF
ncbi:MAG TPA: DUF5916 domain-containing protein [Pyrinomonadaceae bacterium]|nr:DUF5916 domain-containing protein [Pyrinomonadaceae bacterium]